MPNQYHVCARHERGQLFDARGIFCCYICHICEDEKRAQYRVEIFADPNYAASEDIEDDC